MFRTNSIQTFFLSFLLFPFLCFFCVLSFSSSFLFFFVSFLLCFFSLSFLFLFSFFSLSFLFFSFLRSSFFKQTNKQTNKQNKRNLFYYEIMTILSKINIVGWRKERGRRKQKTKRGKLHLREGKIRRGRKIRRRRGRRGNSSLYSLVGDRKVTGVLSHTRRKSNTDLS